MLSVLSCRVRPNLYLRSNIGRNHPLTLPLGATCRLLSSGRLRRRYTEGTHEHQGIPEAATRTAAPGAIIDDVRLRRQLRLLGQRTEVGVDFCATTASRAVRPP